MKSLFLVLSALLPFSAQSAPPAMDSLTALLPNAASRYAGIKNMRMVMPGVLYRGGGTGGKSPMGQAPLEALCADDFSTAVFVYRSGWTGDKRVDCQGEKGANSIDYIDRAWDHPSDVNSLLGRLYSIIVNKKGPMYVHCWYGVHASGYVAAVALRQFCGLSGDAAVKYWNSNTPATIQYPKVQAMIRNFDPIAEYQISAEDKARVCPNL